MTDLQAYLPFIIPLAILQMGLMIAALVHIFTHSTYKMGNRVLWVIVVLFLNTLGPVLYFFLGRDDSK